MCRTSEIKNQLRNISSTTSINKLGRDQLSIRIKNREVCEIQPGILWHSQHSGTSDGTKETVLLASKPKWRNSKQTLEVNLNFSAGIYIG